MSPVRRWVNRRRRKKGDSETRTGDNRNTPTEEAEMPQLRTTDLCEPEANGNADQKDLGEAVLWKAAANLSGSADITTKTIECWISEH